MAAFVDSAERTWPVVLSAASARRAAISADWPAHLLLQPWRYPRALAAVRDNDDLCMAIVGGIIAPLAKERGIAVSDIEVQPGVVRLALREAVLARLETRADHLA